MTVHELDPAVWWPADALAPYERQYPCVTSQLGAALTVERGDIAVGKSEAVSFAPCEAELASLDADPRAALLAAEVHRRRGTLSLAALQSSVDRADSGDRDALRLMALSLIRPRDRPRAWAAALQIAADPSVAPLIRGKALDLTLATTWNFPLGPSEDAELANLWRSDVAFDRSLLARTALTRALVPATPAPSMRDWAERLRDVGPQPGGVAAAERTFNALLLRASLADGLGAPEERAAAAAVRCATAAPARQALTVVAGEVNPGGTTWQWTPQPPAEVVACADRVGRTIVADELHRVVVSIGRP